MNNNFDEFRYIFNLQKAYENEVIADIDISNEDRIKMLELYNSQIQTLKNDVKRKQAELNKMIEWVNKKYQLVIEKLS